MGSVNYLVSYPDQVDIRKVISVADLELTYALSATLITLQNYGQFHAYLAESWKVEKDTITFTLRPNLKWSDGTPLTASDVVSSLQKAKTDYPDFLGGLFEGVKTIKAIGSQSVEFELKPNTLAQEVLMHLTEPMYGISKFKNGKYDANNTSGPYYIKDGSSDILLANKHWFSNDERVQEIVLKRPSDANASDSWADIVVDAKLYTKDDSITNFAKYKKWDRVSDRTVVFTDAGKLKNKMEFRALLRYLRTTVELSEKLNSVLAESRPTIQMYPQGTAYYDSQIELPKTKDELPKTFRTQPIRIFYPGERFSQGVIDQLLTVLKPYFPGGVQIDNVNLEEISNILKSGKYDLLLGVFGVESKNIDAVAAYFFEAIPNLIPSDMEHNFIMQLADLRRDKDESLRLKAYRDLFSKAVTTDSIFPICHHTTKIYTSKKINLLGSVATDEFINLAKVRLNEFEVQ